MSWSKTSESASANESAQDVFSRAYKDAAMSRNRRQAAISLPARD